MKKVSLVITGNEILNGKVSDTNGIFISKKLFSSDFEVITKYTVGDNPKYLEIIFQHAINESDIVIITGGLGPTDDDNTLVVLKKLLGFETAINNRGKKRIEEFLRKLGREPYEEDYKMVTVPDGSIVFTNEKGLAVGFAVKVNGKCVIAMPGFPEEVEYMFSNEVLPFLYREYGQADRKSLEYKLVLTREAEINSLINKMNLPPDSVEWGITTGRGLSTITFLQKDDSNLFVEKIDQEVIKKFGSRLLLKNHSTIEEELLYYFRLKGLSLSTAESCTGGLIAERITRIPGSSDIFMGSAVAYSNRMKEKMLNVPREYFDNYGAVSEEVAEKMAIGARDFFNTNCAISVTGIAGPGGGTDEKPVGLVYICIYLNGKSIVYKENFSGDRERIRFMTSQYALDRLRLLVKES